MRKQLGLSLIELMISITLGLILMTGVMKLFLSSKVVFSTQQGLSRIQETGRLAVDFMSRDISAAGYYGCHRPVPSDASLRLQGLPLGIDNGNLHENFQVGLMGYDSSANLPHGVVKDLGATIAAVETKPAGKDEITGKDKPAVTANILVVRAANQQGLILNEPNSGTTLSAYTTAQATDSAGCIGGICPNSVAVVSDCYKSRAFQVTTLAIAAANDLTINHAGSWGGGANPLESFIVGAEVSPINTNVYFLATGAGGATSLWQKTNNDNAFELLEGVEQMRITYAVSTDNNNYVAASAISAANNWENVWSVRIELLVRSSDDNVLSEPQPYSFAGAAPVTPNDRRMRQVFTTTTAIRSRMILN